MELLNSIFVLATAICVVYFIVRNSVEKNKDAKKKIFKDSVLVGIVSYAVLIFRSNFISFDTSKTTTIFTNEPQF